MGYGTAKKGETVAPRLVFFVAMASTGITGFFADNFHLRNQTSKLQLGDACIRMYPYRSIKICCRSLLYLRQFIRCNDFFKATGHQHLMKWLILRGKPLDRPPTYFLHICILHTKCMATKNIAQNPPIFWRNAMTCHQRQRLWVNFPLFSIGSSRFLFFFCRFWLSVNWLSTNSAIDIHCQKPIIEQS